MEFDDEGIKVSGTVVDFRDASDTLTGKDYGQLLQLSAAEKVTAGDITDPADPSLASGLYVSQKKASTGSGALPVIVGTVVAASVVGLLLFRRKGNAA